MQSPSDAPGENAVGDSLNMRSPGDKSRIAIRCLRNKFLINSDGLAHSATMLWRIVKFNIFRAKSIYIACLRSSFSEKILCYFWPSFTHKLNTFMQHLPSCSFSTILNSTWLRDSIACYLKKMCLIKWYVESFDSCHSLPCFAKFYIVGQVNKLSSGIRIISDVIRQLV